ncbi:MAG: DUF2127 domain-containing protein [Burkholderiaceae bacterium]
MSGAQRFFSQKNVHVAFEVSLMFKGAFALVEIATGVFAYFVTQKILLDIAQMVTRTELTEDPNDFVANYLMHAAQGLTVNSQHFTAFYLLSHGLIKVWLIAGLWRKRLWYYPVTIAIFGALIVYQLYRYTFAASLLLLLITALDAVVVGLTWLEYQHLRRILSVTA